MLWLWMWQAAWATTCGAGWASSFWVEAPDKLWPRGVVVGHVDGPWESAALTERASQYRLVDESRQVVPWTARWLGHRVEFVPREPMEPGDYWLEERAGYRHGRRVDRDADRFDWFPTAVFRVVDGSSPVPAPPASLDLSLYNLDDGITCFGPGLALRALVPPPPNAVALELEVRGLGLVGRSSVLPDHRTTGGRSVVSADNGKRSPHKVAVDPTRPIVARVISIGAEGQRAEGPWTEVPPQPDITLQGPDVQELGWRDLPLAAHPGPGRPIATRCGRLEPVGPPTRSDPTRSPDTPIGPWTNQWAGSLQRAHWSSTYAYRVGRSTTWSQPPHLVVHQAEHLYQLTRIPEGVLLTKARRGQVLWERELGLPGTTPTDLMVDTAGVHLSLGPQGQSMSFSPAGQPIHPWGPVGEPAFPDGLTQRATTVAFDGGEVLLTGQGGALGLWVDEGERRTQGASVRFDGRSELFDDPVTASLAVEDGEFMVRSGTSLGLWEQRWRCAGGETLGVPSTWDGL